MSVLMSLFLGSILGLGLSFLIPRWPDGRTYLLFASILALYVGTAGIFLALDYSLRASLLLPLVVPAVLVYLGYASYQHWTELGWSSDLLEPLESWWAELAGILAGAGYTLLATALSLPRGA
jgi:hypothetical protein